MTKTTTYELDQQNPWSDENIIKKYENTKIIRDDIEKLGSLRFEAKMWVPGLFIYYQLKALKKKPTYEDMTKKEKREEYASILFGEVMLDIIKLGGVGALYAIYKL